MRVSGNLLVIVVATMVLLIAGLVARLAVQGVDESSLFNYFSIMLPLLIPAMGAAVQAHNANDAAKSAHNVAQDTNEVVTETKSTLDHVEQQTNGKLDLRMRAIVTEALTPISSKLDEHIMTHAQEGGVTNAGIV